MKSIQITFFTIKIRLNPHGCSLHLRGIQNTQAAPFPQGAFGAGLLQAEHHAALLHRREDRGDDGGDVPHTQEDGGGDRRFVLTYGINKAILSHVNVYIDIRI